MKKQRFLFTSALALSFFALTMNSCTKLAQNLQYDLTMQTATVNITLPAYSGTNVAATGSQTNTYNIDSFIKANTANVLGINNISSAKLMSCVVQLLNPTTSANFQNFSTCNASFYTNGDTTPYLMTINNNPDTYSTTLNLPVDTTQDIKGYFINGNVFTYSLGGTLRRATNTSLSATATFTFKVHVQG